MAVQRAATKPTLGAAEIRRRARRRMVVGFLRALGHNRVNLLGAIIVLFVLAVSVFGPLLSADPFEMDPPAMLEGPSSAHWFGTDEIGRDQLARVALGLRASTLIALTSVGLAVALGVTLGIIAGYYGGRLDNLIMRVLDVFFAFPGMLFALVMIAVLGPSRLNLIITMGVIFAPGIARLVRGQALTVKEKEFVEAARALGVKRARIMRSHILPNVFAIVIVAGTGQLSAAVLTEAGLSFLGLGVQPPDPSLGGMINSARPFMQLSPSLAVFPGVAISLLVVGFNLLGDALRDALDPRLMDLYASADARREAQREVRAESAQSRPAEIMEVS
jgi:peptide/nickel transport system permease protein